MPYPNVNRAIGAVCSGHPEMMHQLDTVLGTEDMYDLIEIMVVDASNRHEAAKDN
jgi:hypothetical protein